MSLHNDGTAAIKIYWKVLFFIRPNKTTRKCGQVHGWRRRRKEQFYKRQNTSLWWKQVAACQMYELVG